MKQTLLFSICLIISWFTINAQDFTFEYVVNDAKTFTLSDEAGQDVVIKGVLRNNTSEDIDMTWIREEVYLSSGWETAICDPIRCYLPFVSKEEFVLPANDTAILDAHLYPQQTRGDSALLNVRVVGSNAPSDTMEIPYTFYQEQSTATNHIEKTKVVLYPNPASTYFKVKSESTITFVEIYDILGKQLKSVEVDSNTAYVDVLDLVKGIYIIRIKGENGTTLKTQRLRKELP